MKGKHWLGLSVAVVLAVAAIWYFDGPPFRQLRLDRTWGRLSERLDAIVKAPATPKQETELRAWLKDADEFVREAPERADTVWDATIAKTAPQVRLAAIALEALPDAARKDRLLAQARAAHLARLDGILKQGDASERRKAYTAWLSQAEPFTRRDAPQAASFWESCIGKTAPDLQLAHILHDWLPDEKLKDRLVQTWFHKAVKERADLGFTALPESKARATWDKAIASLATDGSQVIALSRQGWLLAHRGQLVVAQGPAQD
jgi:hypothetical protein